MSKLHNSQQEKRARKYFVKANHFGLTRRKIERERVVALCCILFLWSRNCFCLAHCTFNFNGIECKNYRFVHLR